jgi:hypothetical protein
MKWPPPCQSAVIFNISWEEPATFCLASGQGCALANIARHWRNFRQFKPRHEHRRGCSPAPARQFPTCADELDLRPQRNVQNHFCSTAIELLWQLQKRLLRPGLSIGRAKDRNVQRLLFHLIGDGETAEKSTRRARRNVKGCPVAMGFHAGIWGNEIQDRGWCAHRVEILAQSPWARASKAFTQGMEGTDQTWSFARCSSAAARVSSFLQKVKRTCEAPSRASL